MNRVRRWVLASVLFTVATSLGCDLSSAKADWVEGGLYSTKSEDGSFTVIKLLRLDAEGVHVRIYSNRFASHPETVDETALYLAGVDDEPEEPAGIGHLPISRRSFRSWSARFIQRSEVLPSELEGYEMWKEAEGGYFE